MNTKEGRLARVPSIAFGFILLAAAATTNAAPADGIVFWNAADADPNIILSNSGLDIEIAPAATDAAGVRSNRPIYPGEGVYYLEIRNLFPSGNFFSLGIATSDALLQGLDVADTASMTRYNNSWPAVGMIVDYRSEYPVVHFLADTGSGVAHVGSDRLRDVHDEVYLYFAAYRHGSATPGAPQQRLSFGSAEAFTYNPTDAIESVIFEGSRVVEHGWPIDNDHPEIVISSGNGVTGEGGTLSFSGFASDTESGNLSGSINWFLDGVPVGTGSSVNLMPAPGLHTLRAEVVDGAGQRAVATARADVLTNEAVDSDFDGLPYYEEIERGTNPASRDSDFDGLSDSAEIARATDPLSSDTDGDGMTDGYEVENFLNPLSDDAAGDYDSDTHTNLAEFLAGRSAANANDFPGHGTVLLNSADAHTNIVVQPGALSFSVTPASGLGGVRSDISIASGSGWHYFEGYRHADIGNFGFGVATAGASLTAAAGSDGLSFGVNAAGSVTFNGSEIVALTDPEDIHAYGIAVNYGGTNPVAYVLVRPIGGEYEVVGPITMTGVTGNLHIFAYGESQGGVVQQSINAGQDKLNAPFAYSARYLLHQAGATTAEWMRNGWGTAYAYTPLSSVALEGDVRLVRESMTSPVMAISGDGLGSAFADAFGVKSAVRANQAMIGEFRYWEGTRTQAPTDIGFGLINPYAVIDEYCCVTTELAGAPPSMSVNAFGGIWRNLVFQANYDTTNTTYGFAVDYRGSRPIVHVVIDNAVAHTMTLDDMITPIVPMVYATQSSGPVLTQITNFGATPFLNDARQALIDAGVDVSGFVPGWGIYNQALHLGDGPLSEPVITLSGPTAGLTGQSLDIVGTATDAEDGDITVQLLWSNDQTAATGSGGTYSFVPPAPGAYRVMARVTDSSGLEMARAFDFPVTDTDSTPPSVSAPAPLSIDLPSGAAVPASDAAIVAFLAAAAAHDDVDGSISVSNDAPGSFPAGMTTVNFSALDSSGNFASASSVVTVNDTGAPTVTPPANDSIGVTSGTTLAATHPEIAAFLNFASANDDVDGNIAVSNDAPATFPLGATTVNFSATDAAGNSDSASATLTLTDAGAPAVTAPAAISLDLPSGTSIPAGNATIAAFLSGASANDDVDGSVAVTHNAPANFAVGVTTVTFSATDAAGNEGTATATVTISDTGLPSVSAPASISVDLAAGDTVPLGDPQIAGFLAGASATDDVDGSLSVTHDAPGNFPVGTTTVTFSASDTAGNTDSASATVTVNDTGAPVVSAPSNITVGAASGTSVPISNTAIAAFLADASANDDVDGSLAVTHNAPTNFPLGDTTVTFSATDAAGNSASATATVTVEDTGAPTVTAPSDLSVDLDSGSSIPATDQPIATFLAAATASDDVDGSLIVTHDAPASFPVGATTVTFSATDAAGNDATATATVTISDTGAPTLTAPSDLPIDLASGNSILASVEPIASFLTSAAANDDVDGSLSVTHDAPASFPVGSTTVTFSASDAAGNTATASATVTITDTGAPVVSAPASIAVGMPSGTTLPAGNSAIAAFLAAASAGDDVDGNLAVTHNAPANFPLGDTTVTFSAQDAAGNMASASAIVTVTDTGAPTITAPGDIAVGATSGTSVPASNAAIAAFIAAATAHDDVDLDLSGAITNDAPADFPLGDTVVTFSVTDAAGNTDSATATVTINDAGLPQVTVPDDIIFEVESGDSVPATDPAIVAFLNFATATDDVDGALPVSNNAPAIFPIGLTTVTFSAVDAAGNEHSDVASVVVTDTGEPTVIPPQPLTINLAAGNSVAVSDQAIATFLAAANALDAVDGAIAVTHDAPATFPIGTTVVTFSATDSASNTATATASVTINDTGEPNVSAPASITVNVADAATVAASDPAIAAFLSGASAADDVDGTGLAVSHDGPGTFPIGATSVTFSATDAAGNTGSASATVTIADTGAPVVTAPGNLVLSAVLTPSIPASDAAIVSFLAAASATDIVDGGLTVTHDAPADFPVGATLVTFTATDNAGNTATASATVTVNDGGTPTVTPPADISVSITSGSSAAASNPAIAAFLAGASGFDSVDGTLPVANDAPASFPVGTTTVTFSSTDTVGNTGSETATVTVVDAGEPLVIPPVGITLSIVSGEPVAASDPGIAAFLSAASASDDVDGAVAVTHDAPASFPLGVTTVTFSATDAAGNIGSASSSVAINVTNIAPTATLVIHQGGVPVTTATRDGGLVSVSATIIDPNVIDSHSFDWSSANAALTPTSGTVSQTFDFDPAGVGAGVYSIGLTITDDGSGPLAGTASTLVRIIDTAPTLSSTDDSDADGGFDADEGAGDSDGDRVPEYLDPAAGAANQLPTGVNGTAIETSSGLVLRLGETAFTIDAADAMVTIEEVEAWATAIAGGVRSGMDDDYLYPAGIFSIEITNVPVGDSALVVIPLSDALPVNATWREFVSTTGWSRFAADADNYLRSAPAAGGLCPPPGDAAYSDGLSAGNDCVQIRIVDGGANDSDGAVDGTIRILSGPAAYIGPEPDVQVAAVALGTTLFEANDNEQVVLDFIVSSDSDDAELHALTLSASGELDESANVSAVALYFDANDDGIAAAGERLATGSYSADDGLVSFTLGSPHALSVGDNRFLVTYDF